MRRDSWLLGRLAQPSETVRKGRGGMPADIAREKGPVYAVDRENGMEMKNGAGKTGAMFLWKNGVEMGFSTASTFKVRGAARRFIA